MLNNVDVVNGTNCFWIVLDDSTKDPINISIESGNYTSIEIAEELNISVSTSKSQYSRARAYLKRIIIEEKIID